MVVYMFTWFIVIDIIRTWLFPLFMVYKNIEIYKEKRTKDSIHTSNPSLILGFVKQGG